MISALACFISAGILFVEHDVAGIVIGRPNPLTGEVSANFRNADFDGDGAQDLLLPDRVSLQRGGEFPPALSIALPMLAQHPAYDVFGRTLFVRIPGRLEVFRLKGLAWEPVLGHAMDWPDLEDPAGNRATERNEIAPKGRLSRYLHDLSGDGTPEIVLVGLDGLHVYARNDLTYREVRVLEVFPPRKVRLPGGTALWPDNARVVTYPANYLSFRFFLEEGTIALLSNKINADGKLRHTITRWKTDASRAFGLLEEGPVLRETVPLPAFLQPCRLNGDATMDFAGVRWEFATNSMLPERIYETLLTTDGGRTLQSFRTKSFQTLSAFVDFDGDGDRDVIIETTGLYHGGLREFLTRSMTERALRHGLQVHLQDARGRFSETADVRFQTSVGLAQPPFRNGFLFREYQKGSAFNLTGDLNGDGLKDLVVRTRAGRLGIFFNLDLGYAKSPDRELKINAADSFAIADVDGDGYSDIVMQGTRLADGGGPSHGTTVYFSRNTPQ